MWPSSESTWNTVDLFEVKSQQVKKKKNQQNLRNTREHILK